MDTLNILSHQDIPQRTFHMQAFGCQMNASDADWIARSLISRGFVQTDFDKASVHILTTCSVRNKPEQKVYSEIGAIEHFAKVKGRKDIIICVGGCVAQQIGEGLAKRFPLVKLVFGTDGIAQTPMVIEQLIENPAQKTILTEYTSTYTERDDSWEAGNAPGVSYVTIMQGCDNFCSYCIVPYVRGRQKSRNARAVIEECHALASAGAREITLLGQNVNSYGHDLGAGAMDFAGLLKEVSNIQTLERLRFMTPHPKDIAPEVIDAFGTIPKLCPRLHLPLQSGSDAILQAMGRKYNAEKYFAIIERLRSARPDITFTSDIIVGFPGETEEDFKQTLHMMEKVAFAASYSYIYSDRPKAKAVLLPHKVDRKIALERLTRLQKLQSEISKKSMTAQIGKDVVVLLESRSFRKPLPANNSPIEQTSPIELPEGWESWQGRTADGFLVNISLPPFEASASVSLKSWAGALVPIRIDATARHSLKGSITGDAW